MELAINGMNVAMLVTHGVEQRIVAECKTALEAEGALPRVISDRYEAVQSRDGGNEGESVKVELVLNKADAKAFDALILIGGDLSIMAQADKEEVRRFIENFNEDDKPIGAICQGRSLLEFSGLVPAQNKGGSDGSLNISGDENNIAPYGNLIIGPPDANSGATAFIAEFIDSVAMRMQANLRGKADENAVGIASS
jgi:protease I